MPKHISKAIAFTLFDEEIEAWQALEAYGQKMNWTDWSSPGATKVSKRRLLRELMRMAAVQLAADIGPEIAAKLAVPPPLPDFIIRRRRRSMEYEKLQAAAKARKPAKKLAPKPKPDAESKPTRRVYWNRPRKPRAGDVE